MRLDKFISEALLLTRSEAKKKIKNTKILVNGNLIKDAAFSLQDGDEVICDGQSFIASTANEPAYYMLNKPAGYLSASKGKPGELLVTDLISKADKLHLQAVGRLDKDTEGLLLLTNDGDLNHILTSPKKKIEKKYYLEADGCITDDDILLLLSGTIVLDDKVTSPARLEVIENEDNYSKCYITVTEGKYHEVKRLLSACGKNVTYLKRISMGAFCLDEKLEIGQFRPLTEEELKFVRKYKSGTF